MLQEEVKQALQNILGDGYKDDPQTLVTHSYDGTPMQQAMPDAVVYPENTQQVSGIMKVLHKHRIPLISRGSGTNLCGGTVPVSGGDRKSVV